MLARKSHRNEVVVAVARKMTAWYLLKGLWEPLLEISPRTQVKLSKIIGAVQVSDKAERRQCFQKARERLLQQGIYLLDPTRTFAV